MYTYRGVNVHFNQEKALVGAYSVIVQLHRLIFCSPAALTKTYEGFNHYLHVADLGSNIGMFSVTAATLGRKVVAVDASIQNLAYIDKSVHLNGNQKNVKLINNAVRCLDRSQYVT